MSRVAKLLLLPVLLISAAMLVSACGEEDRSHLLPGESVQEIEANIDTVQAQVDEGLCLEALESADQVQKQVESLPRTVDPELRRALLDGAVTLIQLVRDNCEESGATGTTEEAELVEPEVEVTPTGDTGATDTEEETGTTGTTGNQDKPEKPAKPDQPDPEPTPEPDPPTPPVTTPEPEPPVDTGPGSGGITPNQ